MILISNQIRIGIILLLILMSISYLFDFCNTRECGKRIDSLYSDRIPFFHNPAFVTEIIAIGIVSFGLFKINKSYPILFLILSGIIFYIEFTNQPLVYKYFGWILGVSPK